MKNTILRNEVGAEGGDGGGAGAVSAVDGAAPIEGAIATDGTPAVGVQSEGAPAPTEGHNSLTSKIFNTTGNLAEGWEQTMRDNGMEQAIPYFGRESLGGNQDSIVKGLANLVSLSGKKVEAWSENEVGALTDGQRNDMMGKLRPLPATPEEYDIQGMETFKGQELPAEFVDYWSKAAQEIGVTRNQVEQFFTKNGEFMASQTEAATTASTEAAAVSKTAVQDHFRAEWGGDYASNADLVNTYADSNLDPANPLHVQMLNDKTGLSMILKLAQAENDGRSEGSLPTPGSAVGTGGNAGQNFDTFLSQNPGWQAGDAAKVAEGNRLGKLAKLEFDRIGR